MTKNFGILKRSLSLLAVVMIMVMSMTVPAFAAQTTCTGNTTDEVCKVLNTMYGNDSAVSAAGYADAPTNELSYGVTVTLGNGETRQIYIAQRPDVNDVQVTMGTDGRLDVYGMGNGDANTWNQFYAKYKSVIVGISGVGAITFIALFIIQFMKLGTSAGNPQARSQALSGCLWTGIAAAALGAVSIIAGFFYNAV